MMQTIKKGASGKDVEQLQQLLCQRGYKIGVDGIFGKATDEAVRKFQEDNGLTADGIVGQRTWEMLQCENPQALASLRLKSDDYAHAAELLGVEVAAVRAVLDVETGNKGGLAEYDRLERARSIHREAADSSASWGLAQIMGFNYSTCGSQSVSEFVDAMSENEGKQLELFVRFIKGSKWDKYLKDLDWKEFARHYNGPSYAENQYDKKLAKAYEKYK